MYTIYEGHSKSSKPLQERVHNRESFSLFLIEPSLTSIHSALAMFMHCNSLTEYGCILVPEALLHNTDCFQTGNQEGVI